MKKCPSIQSDLAAFLSGELEEARRREIKAHLEACPDCGRSLAEIEAVFRHAGKLEPEIEKELASTDWEAQADEIVSAVWAARPNSRPEPESRRFWFFSPQYRPALAGLVLGFLLGGLATLAIFRTTPRPRPGGERYRTTPEFLDRVDLEIARRDTLDYLEKSQDVLLDFVGPGKEMSPGAADQARELLAKKKFLNPELDKAQMAKAREICDQIEILFHRLTEVAGGLTPAQRAELKALIETRDIFLKIRLLKREIQESEV